MTSEPWTWRKSPPTVLQERNQEITDLLAKLKACSTTRNLQQGEKVHAEAVKCGHHSNIYIASALINMYARCGSMVGAREVFDNIQQPTVVSWNALIVGYAANGQGLIALNLLRRMRNEGAAPNSITFMCALKACKSLAGKEAYECLQWCKELHNLVVENYSFSDIYVQNSLIELYGRLGSMGEALQVFETTKHRNVVSWTVLILGYADNGQGLDALNLFRRMVREGPVPDSLTLVAVLKASTTLLEPGASGLSECIDWVKELHCFATDRGYETNIYVQNTLVDMYARCGCMVAAREVFDGIHSRDVVSWNVLIQGYAEGGEGRTALDLFRRMTRESGGCAPDYVTFLAVLKACTSLALKEDSGRVQCKQMHNLVIENGFDSNTCVQNTLLDLYAKSKSMFEARAMFDIMKNPTVVSWNVLILGYAENGESLASLDLFTRMSSGTPAPDSVTFAAVLKACISLVLREGASARGECREWGMKIHDLALENGCYTCLYVQSTLIDLYAKCDLMVNAREVFDSTKHPNVVSWNVLILGYADSGQGLTALDLFRRMKSRGPAPDSITYAAALKLCALLGALDLGRTLHLEIENGDSLTLVLVNSLVNFYAKSGSMVEAQGVFDFYKETRDTITWNALLGGLDVCGDHESVFKLFKEMRNAGFQPSSVTFISILTCCSHAGLVEKGKECFDTMCTVYGIIPTIEHHICMVDIFGRANKLDDAMALLQCMRCSPNSVAWRIILSACCKWKNVEIGRLAFQNLTTLEKDGTNYVLMGILYGSRGMWQEQEAVMGLMRKGIF